MRRLPDDLRREVNRLAYALAQASYVEHRQRLQAEALALLKAGRVPAEVLAQLATTATGRH